jgi:hypothetical protein
MREMGKSRRHHYIAEFYLRNFTEPMFGRNLFVYERKTHKWDPRTPKGIGWFPHLYTMLDDFGERTTYFEKFLADHIETPIAPIMKKAATAPEQLTHIERENIAMFIGVTAARTPSMVKETLDEYFDDLPIDDIAELKDLVKVWCSITGRNYTAKSKNDFMKPSMFRAILIWAASLRDRLIKWNWTFIRTARNRPFITSDSPVLAQKQGDIRLVTFPISSEISVVICNTSLANKTDRENDVITMNRGTMQDAKEFVICHMNSFPCDTFIKTW